MIYGQPQPRLKPLEADEWGEAEYAAFGTMLGLKADQVPKAGSGHKYDPLNFSVVGTLVRHPDLARAFLSFNSYQLQRGSLPVRWRELSILRVAHVRRSAYEWGQHVKMAVDAGITTTEIEKLSLGNAGFDGVDRVVLQATDELLQNGRLGDQAWRALNAELSTHQMMDLIFIVGTYAMLAMAFESWQLTLEPDTAPLPPAA